MKPLPPRDEMERAFFAADASYDGVFVTGVRTTRIFCRPSCAARKPRLQNLEFFASTAEARAAGYRACLRCRPLENGREPAWLPHLLARITRHPDRPVGSRDLTALGVEPARARRAFRTLFGMTLAEYSRAWRVGYALERLQRGESLDAAVFASGFESHSGFREAFRRLAGRPPGRAGSITRVALAWFETPIGRLIAGATGEGICLLEFTDRPALQRQLESVRQRLDAVLVPGESPHLDRLRDELREYFDGARQAFSVPLVAPGSPFEERVWHAVRQIPYGHTRTYHQVARAVERPDAARAVGRANGLNRIAILIPCHRVVGANGALVGYGGGVWRKRRLLELERASMAAAPAFPAQEMSVGYRGESAAP